MEISYGVLVSGADAQIQLHSLVRSLFGSTATDGASGGFRPRRAAAPAFEVGGSITPTSGHLDK